MRKNFAVRIEDVPEKYWISEEPEIQFSVTFNGHQYSGLGHTRISEARAIAQAIAVHIKNLEEA